MRYLLRKTFRPPALRATRWSALLVMLLYLLAGNLHTCGLGGFGSCCPQEVAVARNLGGAKIVAQSQQRWTTVTTLANVPPCCRHLLCHQTASDSRTTVTQTTVTSASKAQVAPDESCPACRFCLAKLLHHTPAQASAVFALPLQSSRAMALLVCAFKTTSVGMGHRFQNRGPPFVV